tara:strand:+ start:469 stop:1608 length:1140 start_codon:yes stop_codon:yes gene_type:complete
MLKRNYTRKKKRKIKKNVNTFKNKSKKIKKKNIHFKKNNVNSKKTRKHRGGAMSHSDVQNIVSNLELDELEKYYFISKEFKGAIDQKVRGLYRDNYGDDPDDGMSIKEFITKIKIANISSFPPNNGTTVLHIDGDFGHPDKPLDSDKLFKLRIKLIPPEFLKDLINMIFTDYFLENYHFDSEDFLKTLSKSSAIFTEQPIYKDFQNTFKDMKDGNLEFDESFFFSFFKSDDFQEEMIEKLALIKDSDDLELFVDEIENNEDYRELIEIIQYELDIIIDKSNSQVLMSHIEKSLIDDDKYRVGDFFFRYNYHNPSEQSYGLCAVGYDLKNNKKIPIIDGEGVPDIPQWIIEELDRRNITWKEHSIYTDELQDYFNSRGYH